MDTGAVQLPFGKYKGQAIDQVAKTDRGLLYLDWLVGEDWLRTGLKDCLESYLTDPAIAADLERLTHR